MIFRFVSSTGTSQWPKWLLQTRKEKALVPATDLDEQAS